MKVDGRCHCGDVSFEAEIDPEAVMICHCTDCQTFSGSAFRTVAVSKEGSFRLLSGTCTTYVKVADSGNRRTQAFCPRCGTSLYSAPADGDLARCVLRIGTLSQRAALTPSLQLWGRSAVPWACALVDVPLMDTQPAMATMAAAAASRPA